MASLRSRWARGSGSPDDGGQYMIVAGNSLTVTFDRGNLRLFDVGERLSPEDQQLVRVLGGLGMRYIGAYDVAAPHDVLGDGAGYPPAPAVDKYAVVSFLYHKRGRDGNLEEADRVVVVSGLGAGVHPDHHGQDPTFYVVGPQIGTWDMATDTYAFVPKDTALFSKNFSLDCMTFGVCSENPILANPALPQPGA